MDGKKHEIQRDILMPQSQPNNTDFDMVLMVSTASATATATVVVLFSFLLSVGAAAFFPSMHTPRMPKINFVHTLSVAINKRKGLMNSTHAYVFHAVQWFFSFGIALFSA